MHHTSSTCSSSWWRTLQLHTQHSFTSASVYFSTNIFSNKHQISSLQKLTQGDCNLEKNENPRHFPDVSSHCSPSGGLCALTPDHHSRNEVNNVVLSNSKFPWLLAISITTVQNPTFPGSWGLALPCFITYSKLLQLYKYISIHADDTVWRCRYTDHFVTCVCVTYVCMYCMLACNMKISVQNDLKLGSVLTTTDFRFKRSRVWDTGPPVYFFGLTEPTMNSL